MLTDVQIRKAKGAEKPYKMQDGGGLHLYVTPSGTKSWRYRYEFQGKEKSLSIGQYPAVSLSDARSTRDSAREAVRTGRDPSLLKKQAKLHVVATSQETFEVVAREWHGLMKGTWAVGHAQRVLGSLEESIFPEIGPLPIREINAPVVLAALRKVEARGAVDTAHRIRQRVSAVFVYAISSGRADTDPAAMVGGAMQKAKRGRRPAITDLEKAREIIRTVEAVVDARPTTKLALRLLAITALRPGTLVTTPWSELAGLGAERPTWQIPAARMKLLLELKDDESRDHFVPLPRQALDVIEAMRALSGRGPLVFPSTRHPHKPMSVNALGYLMNRAGYHTRHVPHGWRSTFSTVMNERRPADHRIIDLMLAHVPKDKVEAAYNRSEHLEARRAIAQEWADLLMDGFPPATSLLPARISR